MAAGPQPPLWLSFQLSQRSMLPASRRCASSELSRTPCIASTIWVPATAHQSLVSCEAKTRPGVGAQLDVHGARAGASASGSARRPRRPSAWAEASSSGSVTSMVGRVSRSGGGSSARRTRSTRWSKRSPVPSVFVQTRPVPTTAHRTAPIRSSGSSGVRAASGWLAHEAVRRAMMAQRRQQPSGRPTLGA